MNRPMNLPTWSAAIVAALFLSASGCASLQAPNDQLSAAELSVRKADENLAAKHAPLELVKAREKIGQAKLLIAQGEFADARRLLEQATVDAQLADEKALTAKAQETALQMKRSVTALQEETERRTDGR